MRAHCFIKLKETVRPGFRGKSRKMSVICFVQGACRHWFEIMHWLIGIPLDKSLAEDRGHDRLANVGICPIDLICSEGFPQGSSSLLSHD